MHIARDMGVSIQREGCFRMAKNAGERFGIHAAGQCMGGEGMSEIVEAHVGQFRFSQQLLHAVVSTVGHDGIFRTDGIVEDPL